MIAKGNKVSPKLSSHPFSNVPSPLIIHSGKKAAVMLWGEKQQQHEKPLTKLFSLFDQSRARRSSHTRLPRWLRLPAMAVTLTQRSMTVAWQPLHDGMRKTCCSSHKTSQRLPGGGGGGGGGGGHITSSSLLWLVLFSGSSGVSVCLWAADIL